MLRDVIKPGAHGHLSCSSLQFALWYKYLLSQFTEDRTSVSSEHENLGSENEESEAIEKQPVFGIDTSALHYTRAVRSY